MDVQRVEGEKEGEADETLSRRHQLGGGREQKVEGDRWCVEWKRGEI